MEYNNLAEVISPYILTLIQSSFKIPSLTL